MEMGHYPRRSWSRSFGFNFQDALLERARFVKNKVLLLDADVTDQAIEIAANQELELAPIFHRPIQIAGSIFANRPIMSHFGQVHGAVCL